MADSTRSSTVVDASPGEVLDIIADLEAYPEWAKEIRQVEILTEDGDGWPDTASFSLDAGPIQDTYTLDYTWDVAEDGQGVASWTLVEATMLKAMDGSYTLSATADGGTEVVYELTVDLKVPMLGMLKRKAEKVIVDTALRDLKKRAEA
ncbi:SRPBCC family protein [Janibacter indicus]|uniref:Ribosome association toxin PasT (RatA) of the RatAB toxin-antitoxin module n=1 Tax=Janibacter indicus TaxID=857417 RepID=A0A1W2A469_9MICO|nr:SRPBCC family protein [Janibacter indicus]SMC55211.1 Ribosome association toxin PasT (RatA) of the RatAB toxin-antitoxin module [Janibacter indicus]